MLSQIDHLDQATSYIISLQARIEKMTQRKNIAKVGVEERSSSNECEGGGSTGATAELRLPAVEVRHQDSSLEVVLISGLDRRFVFHEVISVLEEEGAHVVNANFSVVGEKIFHTIHSQVPLPFSLTHTHSPCNHYCRRFGQPFILHVFLSLFDKSSLLAGIKQHSR